MAPRRGLTLSEIQEIAADHAIHPIQVSQWKKQLLEGASEPDRRSAAVGGGEFVAYTCRSPDKSTENEDTVAVIPYGPGAAVMLIFSQIFKKPLEEVGQVFYGMSGPWDEPVIETVSSDNFVRYGELAGCLAARQEGP